MRKAAFTGWVRDNRQGPFISDLLAHFFAVVGFAGHDGPKVLSSDTDYRAISMPAGRRRASRYLGGTNDRSDCKRSCRSHSALANPAMAFRCAAQKMAFSYLGRPNLGLIDNSAILAHVSDPVLALGHVRDLSHQTCN